jgi:serine/threonine protein kinase
MRLDDEHLLQAHRVQRQLPRQLRAERALVLRRRRLGLTGPGNGRRSAKRWLAMSNAGEIGQGLPIALLPGRLIAGKYRVEQLLGRGGMGYVVLAKHIQLDQPVALKFMHAWRANKSPEQAAWFLGEARAAARIRSDHVARVSDTGALEDGSPYVVMEYLEGQDFSALLQQRRLLSISVVVDYAMQAIEGLAEAHAAGIVHRDLKPSNLFLARQSDGSVRIKLLDFGIATMAPRPGASVDSGEVAAGLCGSPLYMAPEQVRASRDADQRVDIWSLGVVLYEMLTATSPFGGDTIAQICGRVLAEQPAPLRTLRSDVPPTLDAAVMQCLEKDPQRRFRNVGALARALAPFGGPDASAAAARIERIVRGRARKVEGRPNEVAVPVRVPEASLTIGSFNRAVALVAGTVCATEAEEPATAVQLAPVSTQITHTQVSFDPTARRSLFDRLPPKGILAAAGVLAVAAAVVIAGTTRADKSVPDPISPTKAEARSPASTPMAIPMPDPIPPPISVPPPIAVETPIATESGSAAAPTTELPRPALPPPSRAAIPPADRKPSAPAPATGSAAPIGTSGFGGRE